MPKTGPSTHDIGRRVEMKVERHLVEGGWLLMGRNIRGRGGGGEIDRVFFSGETLVVVEIKYRERPGDIPAEHSLTPAQTKRLLYSATWYAASCGHDGDLRLDLLLVTGPEGAMHIHHVVDAGRLDD